MKTIFFSLILLACDSLMFFETASAQPVPAALPVPCNTATRSKSPQLAKVCSVTPPFTPKYKEYFLIAGTKITRKIVTNGIPNHKIGLFPIYETDCGNGRPTPIWEHSATYLMPASVGARSTTYTFLKIGEKLGVALNGVILDPLADEYWNSDVKWRKNALLHPDMVTDLDCNMAHIQADSAYHYHALPTGLYELLGGSYPWNNEKVLPVASKTVQLGWAFDGTPLYGPVCYKTGIINWWKPKSGWVLKGGGRGAGTPGGTYNGDYDYDFEYLSTAGDLDEVNGHYGPTPEYPDGVYHQHITEEFPYIPRGYLNVAPSLAALASKITVDISSIQKNTVHFKAYPNPVKSILNVELSGKAIFTLTQILQ